MVLQCAKFDNIKKDFVLLREKHIHICSLVTSTLWGFSVSALIKSDLRRHNINIGIANGDIKAVSNEYFYD